jgi:hypothetical protein
MIDSAEAYDQLEIYIKRPTVKDESYIKIGRF